MFIKVTKVVEKTSIYINVNNIESIGQDDGITIIITNTDKWYYVKETVDEIIRTINYSNMISVS